MSLLVFSSADLLSHDQVIRSDHSNPSSAVCVYLTSQLHLFCFIPLGDGGGYLLHLDGLTFHMNVIPFKYPLVCLHCVILPAPTSFLLVCCVRVSKQQCIKCGSSKI